MRRYINALDIAGYVTWTGVAMELLRISTRHAPVGPVPARELTIALLFVFLVAFFFATRPAPPVPRWIDRWPLASMLASTFALIALGPSNSSPILLIIVAVVAMLVLSATAAAVLMIAANIVLAIMLELIWQEDRTLRVMLTFGGFQLFAALASHAMRRAREGEEALRKVNAQLLATRSLLAESARESERLRLSRELHDVSGHKLTALKLNLAVLGRDPGLAPRGELQTARDLVDELLQDIRGVVAQLRSHHGIDLRGAFARLAETLPSLRVHIDVAEDARVGDAARAEALLRLVQEGLTNAARHSGAQNVWIRLARESGTLQLVVEDDGRGGVVNPGYGLTGMRERVTALAGELHIERAAAGGLRLRAHIPAERAS